MIKSGISKTETIELWATPEQFNRWEKMANTLGFTIYEYIRKCTDAHTTILESDQFNTISYYDKHHHKEER